MDMARGEKFSTKWGSLLSGASWSFRSGCQGTRGVPWHLAGAGAGSSAVWGSLGVLPITPLSFQPCSVVIEALNHALPIIIQSLPIDSFISYREVCSDQPFTNFLSCLQWTRKVASETASSPGAVSPNGLITRLPAPPSQREHRLVYLSQRVWLNRPITALYKALTELLEGRAVSKGIISSLNCCLLSKQTERL